MDSPISAGDETSLPGDSHQGSPPDGQPRPYLQRSEAPQNCGTNDARRGIAPPLFIDRSDLRALTVVPKRAEVPKSSCEIRCISSKEAPRNNAPFPGFGGGQPPTAVPLDLVPGWPPGERSGGDQQSGLLQPGWESGAFAPAARRSPRRSGKSNVHEEPVKKRGTGTSPGTGIARETSGGSGPTPISFHSLVAESTAIESDPAVIVFQ